MRETGFLRSVELKRDDIPDPSAYPFSLLALRTFTSLEFHPKVTFLVGENGMGKSTLLEAIAVALGFNAEGGSRNFRFVTKEGSTSSLSSYLRVVRSTRRPKSEFFLRAESFFNVATEIERLDAIPGAGAPITGAYGGASLHEQSHGESFLSLILHRFRPEGLYLLDEPEAALSPQRQLAMLRRMHELVRDGAQFIISTHSPMLLAFPDATIHEMSERGVHRVPYEETDSFRITRDFLSAPDTFLRKLFED